MRDRIRAMICVGLMGLCACGAEPINETHEGTLETGDTEQTDGSLMDMYEFEAQSGFAITVQMESEELAPYLIVTGPDGQKVGETDDNNPEARETEVSLVASDGGSFRVQAGAVAAGMTGPYTVRIRTSSQ